MDKEFQVHKYFFRALSSLWHIVEPTLTDKSMTDYTVTFTGHSLGGALASLAAARAALDGLRSGDKIKVVTFGQPRTGSAEFAINYDKMIKYR
jgi:predicted lipase